MPRFAYLLPLIALGLCACAEGAGATIEPIGSQSVAVHETLRIPLRVRGGGGMSLSFRFEGPELPGLDRTARISGGADGGEFRWSPLSSHVGTHEFTFVLVDEGGGTVHRRSAVIEVRPPADAAPVFLRPGAGGTYDLERDPCVVFDVEVRDDDTPDVDIRARGLLPEGAALLREGPKRARFDWCPTPDQVDASERWTIGIEADDGDHPPTELDYVAVLRTGPKEGCPGEPPVVTVTSPAEGERRLSEPGYTVRISVTDDGGLRDAPLLYWTTSIPDDLADPDVTAFEQVTAVEDGSAWRARIPSLGLADGAEQTVYVVASATDNDDDSGTLCDHRADSALVRFVAVGSSSGSGAPLCDPCTASTECASAVCASAAGGGRCLESCAGGAACAEGTCADRTTTEGAVVRACGSVDDVCSGGGGPCVDDSREPNDSVAGAVVAPASLSDGQICAYNDDYYRVDGSSGTEVRVTVDGFVHAEGDLDLQLLSATGAILASSAGTSGSESASHCLAEAGALYARVFGYRGAENQYSMRVEETPGACCVDDAGEDDDTRLTARRLSGTDFDGSICPGDDDFLRFRVDGPSRVSALITFDTGVGDLDLELYGPSGSVVGSSRGTGDTESVDVDVTEAGDYVIRVYGFRDAAGDYLGEITVTATSGCASSAECPSSEVCDAGSCVDDSCTSTATCPSGHVCPVAGPGTPTSHCGTSCSVNSDCRSYEACKWFSEGRYCGRRGSGLNGDVCATFADCGGQRACLPLPNGYCARVGCSANTDCESGTYCVPVGGQNVCVKDCLASDDLCRLSEGYECSIEYDTSDVIQWVCVPPGS